jgi:hypothetical protein
MSKNSRSLKKCQKIQEVSQYLEKLDNLYRYWEVKIQSINQLINQYQQVSSYIQERMNVLKMPILLLRVDFDRYLKWSKLNRKIKACWCDSPKVKDKIIVCNYTIESVCVSPHLPVFHNFFLNSNFLGNDNTYKLKHYLFLNFQKWLSEVIMFLILTFAVGMCAWA